MCKRLDDSNVGKSVVYLIHVLLSKFRTQTLALLFTSGISASAVEGEFDFFESKIRPVLVNKCYECHSVEAANSGKQKGGLLLDTREGI